MAPKAQHTVPRLHLQNFAGTNPPGQVWTYDSTSGKCWSKIADETGIQTHFYSVGRDDGTHDTRIEEMLSGFESRAAPVYESLLRGDIPKVATQERVHFAEFLGVMFVRTSAMRRMHAEITSRRLQTVTFAYSQNPRAFDGVIRRVEQERGEPIDAETKEEVRRAMAEPGDYEILIPKERTLLALGTADALAPIFHNMKWSLAYPVDGYFITGDNPVVRKTDPATHHPAMGDGGFRNKTAETSFPLSKDVMLITSWDQSARDHGMVDVKTVNALNELRSIYADRYLYAHTNDVALAALAERFKDKKPAINSFGYGPPNFAPTKVGR